MDIDLTPLLVKKWQPYRRTLGRFNSSEVFFLNNGSTTPEEWLKPKERPVEDILKMWSGVGMHDQLDKLLGKEFSEKKREFFYKDITIVGKVDYLPPNAGEVWEFKTSDKKMKEMKPWHEHQVKMYATMFEVPKGLVYQPVQNKAGLYLKHLGTVERDDAWFQEELEKLYQFSLRIKNIL
jgi:hypothetical protein